MRAETERAMGNIVECFTAEDGGVKFAKFNSMINSLDEQAENGDPVADQVVSIVRQFSRLIDVPDNCPDNA